MTSLNIHDAHHRMLVTRSGCTSILSIDLQTPSSVQRNGVLSDATPPCVRIIALLDSTEEFSAGPYAKPAPRKGKGFVKL